MTSATTPRASSTVPALYRLFVHTILTRGRVLGVAALGLLGIVIAVAVASGEEQTVPGSPTGQAAVEFVNDFGLTFLAPVCALVFATSALGDLRDDGSLVYLWLRPVSRWQITAAAYGAVLTIVVPLVVVPVAVGAAIIDPDGAVVGASTASVAVAVVAYAAVFLGLGLRASRALIWGLVYVLLWEGFVSQVGGTPARLSIANYTRSILTHATGTDLDPASASIGAAYLVPLAVAAVALAYTTRRFQRQDVA